ncbi:MAG: hypothetical protein RR478_05700, partial [Bacilli bacterium]
YIYIDISKLSISNGYLPVTLGEIDSFTMCFTKEEIMNAIIDANIAKDKYLNGKLCITDNQKHNPIDVITKDFLNEFNINLFLKENIKNKNLMNNIVNKLVSLISDTNLITSFKIFIKNEDITGIENIIFSIPYLTERKLFIYLIEMNNKILKSKKERELVRDKSNLSSND